MQAAVAVRNFRASEFGDSRMNDLRRLLAHGYIHRPQSAGINSAARAYSHNGTGVCRHHLCKLTIG